MRIALSKVISLSFFLLLLSSFEGLTQKLPVRPNLVDSKSQRQGAWCIWMDALWQPTNDSTQIVYYRLIQYKDDKPVGVTLDFYRTGKKQYEGLLLEDRPQEVQDGIHIWYYASGEKRILETFEKGESKNQKIFLRSGEPADPEWIVNHYRKGEHFSDENKYGESVKEFLIALENAEAFFGRESEEYATVADWLGIVSGLNNDRAQSIRFKEEFVSIRKLIHTQPDTLMLNALADLGTYYKLEKNWPLAKKRFKEFLNYNSSYFHANHPSFPEVIQTLGTVCEAMREYDDALFYLTDAEKIFRASPEKYEYPFISNVLSLAGLYLSRGEMMKGEQFLSEKIKYLKSKYGNNSEYYESALGLLARLHVGSGQYKLAEQEWTEQLTIIKRNSGEQSAKYAGVLGSLAELYVMLGDVAKADKYIQQARKIYDGSKSEHEIYLQFLIKLSTIYQLMGNKNAWLESLKKRTDLTLQTFGKNSVPHAQVLSSQAWFFFFEKKWDAVIQLANESLSVFKSNNSTDLNEQEKTTLAQLYQLLSTAYLMQYFSKYDPNKLSLAQNNAEESIHIFETLPNHETLGSMNDSYVTLALIYDSKKETENADHYYNRALTNTKKQFGENNFQLIDLLFLIAKKSEVRKDFKSSFAYYKKAIDQHHTYIQNVFPYLSEDERERLYEKNKLVLQSFYGFAAQYHEKVPGLSELWYDVVMQQKGIILQSFAPIREAIFASSNEAAQQTFNQWQSAKNEYAQLVQNPESDQNKVTVLLEQLNDLEKKLGEFSVHSKPKQEAGWRDLQKSLQQDEAAIEVVYVVEDTEDGYDSSYYALIVKQNISKPVIVKLHPAQDMEGRPFKFYRNAIKLQQEDLASYSNFWKPMETSLAGVKKIWLSSEGVYHQINPSTFFNPATKKYLQEEVAIQSVPSTSWVLNERKNPLLAKATIFAHPDYGAVASVAKTDLTRSLDLDNIRDLPGTEKELEDMKTLFKKYNIAFQDFEGSQASEDEVKKMNRPQVLHIATHGYFLPEIISKDQPQNPLLRSGLLMAGCQKKPHLQNPTMNDGVLTAFEASALPLYQTSLVVMSACETGLGDVKNGEGVYGLQRAFLMAGAQRVLMSLWKVDDEATREFMIRFYEGWITLKDIGKAHQYAQQQVREKYPHPYYWGAFVLSGN